MSNAGNAGNASHVSKAGSTSNTGSAGKAGITAITAIGVAKPPGHMTVEQLASRGVEAAKLQRDAGFEGKDAPGPEVSPWHLLVEASREALHAGHVGPADLDLLLTVGRNRLDYLCFGYSLTIMKELRLTRGVGVDLGDYTGGTLLTGLRVLDAKFRANPQLQTALLAVHHRFSDLVDLAAPKDFRLWPVGDGAAALVVRRDAQGSVLLGHAFANEGRAKLLLATRQDTVDEGPDPTGFFEHEWASARYITLRNPEGWFADYRERCARRLPEVVQQAVDRAGLRLDDIARVQAGFLYPEVHEQVTQRLGLGARFQRYNAGGYLAGVELGHALAAMQHDASLRGKNVVLCHAGLPAEFGAVVLRL